MPNLETIYADYRYPDVAALKDWMIRANAYGFVTKRQGVAIVDALTPMLPVTAMLQVRTSKGVIYITANGRQLRISRRGDVDYKPWNTNPRRPARNPWAN
jgi:hypothetical protein